MSARPYIGRAYLDELQERLSKRDWAVIDSLARVRCLSGDQLEWLHFTNLSERTRGHRRRTVLARLTRWRVVATLDRRIGGVQGGSAGLIFILDVAGQRLVEQRPTNSGGRVIRAGRSRGKLLSRTQWRPPSSPSYSVL
jgi:hypothetical protein